MMDKKQLVESQKECASMLGMNLTEYEEYRKNVKVNEQIKSQQTQKKDFLNLFEIKESDLKLRKG